MKTTIDLDDLDEDVLSALQEQADLLDLSLQQVFHDALRRGMEPVGPSERPAHEVTLLPGKFRPEIDQTKFNQPDTEFEENDLAVRRSA